FTRELARAAIVQGNRALRLATHRQRYREQCAVEAGDVADTRQSDRIDKLRCRITNALHVQVPGPLFDQWQRLAAYGQRIQQVTNGYRLAPLDGHPGDRRT